MAEILKRNKALAVNPLKASQPVGASLAFLGINRAIPMLHGSQGCTAFGKVYFVRHFREPIPLQTTAMDQVSTVMSADENVILGLATICEKSKPAMIGLPTTGLSETQGTDIKRLVKEFYAAHPEFAHIPVVPVNTPDFTGCLESGYALALKAVLEALLPKSNPLSEMPSPQSSPASGRGGEREKPYSILAGEGAIVGSNVGRRKKQVNVLAASFLTPGDIEHIKEMIEAFGLRPLVLPDIGDSLDGHLTETESSPLTVGGTPVSDIASMGESVATLVLGSSLNDAADFLKAQTNVPDYRFDCLMGLEAVDAFVSALAEISGKPVPERVARQRAQLQDAMVDAHFMLGFARIAIAADPDLLYNLSKLVSGMGCEVVAAVASARANILSDVAAAQVGIGDLDDLESAARRNGAQLVISNSHAAESARRLGVPLLRAGFPQYDLIGGYQRLWVGYRGTRQALFDLANLLAEHGQHEPAPYISIYNRRTGESRATPAANGQH
ncbi:MAG TPA: nitrogenase iron-molybdenum cofactor biosynthesis protein NifN [Gallionella sp.]|nr:nitrogenase iron-molybdenum cofactor biosynthesis protein NifN [Gallionella sp.]